MPTAEQKKDLERLQRYIQREGLTSCMNDTKWDAAVRAIQSVPRFSPRFRARCVKDQQGVFPKPWDGSFPWHVPTFKFIEWLELDPILRTPLGHLLANACEDFTEQLCHALSAAHVPFSIEDGAIRIWGYLRPGSSPRFVGPPSNNAFENGRAKKRRAAQRER
jgi:hypothetical protein